MTKRHAFLNRNAVRGLAAVAALGCVQVAQAADPKFDSFMGRVVGNQTTVGFGGGGVPLVTSSAPLGNPAIGNMGLAQAGRDVSIGGTAKIPLGATGKSAAVNASAKITAGSLLGGLASKLTHPAVSIGLLAAAPLLDDWMRRGKVAVNHMEDDYPKKPFLRTEKTNNDLFSAPYGTEEVWHFSANSACTWFAGKAATAYAAVGYQVLSSSGSASGLTCWWNVEVKDSRGTQSSLGGGTAIQTKPVTAVQEVAASLQEIIEYMDAPEAPQLTPGIVEQAVKGAGIDPFGAQTPEVTVTGPASVPGEKVTTTTSTRVQQGTTTESSATTGTEPATKTTTQTTAHNLTYNDNKVTYNTKTTTTTNITNNITNQTNTTTDAETVKEGEAPEQQEEPQKDLCEKNPDALACQKVDLDTPEGEIPKTTRELTYHPENNFGGGSCPANVYTNVSGRQVQVFDWAQSCSMIATYVRPIILLLGAMAALLILIPGRGEA